MIDDKTGILVFQKNSAGLIVFGQVAGVLPTTANKFATGCILISTNGTLYTNAGTSASPSFQNVNDITTSEIANGAVTGAKMSSVANTRVVAVNIGAIANGGQDNHIFVAPSACTITNIVLVSDTATSGSDGSNNYTFQVVNKTQTNNLLATAVTTNSNEISADTAYDVTPDQNATLATDDVLELTTIETGVATDLTGAKVTAFISYTVSA